MDSPPRVRQGAPVTARARRRSLVLLIAGACVAAGTAAAIWWGSGPAVPSPARATALVRMHNAAVAALEAGDPAAADPLLVELIDEPLPAGLGVRATALRNRAVGAVLAIDPQSGHAVQAGERSAWFIRAAEATGAFETHAPNDPAAPYLISRLIAATGNDGLEASALARCAENAPGQAWPLVRLAEVSSRNNRPADRENAIADWKRAVELEPGNTWILLNALRATAGGKNGDAARHFAALHDRLVPSMDGLAQRHDGAIFPLIDAGEAAATAGDWPAARRSATQLFNVLRSEEVVRADRLAVERTALDFLAPDLPPAFYEATGLARTPDPAAIPVSYQPFAGPAAAPPVAGVLALDAANMNLRGREELILLTADAVTVHSRDDDGAWAETTRYHVDSGSYTGVTAADLDLDSQAAASPDAGSLGAHTADPDLVLWGPGGVLLLENRRRADGGRSLLPFSEQEAFSALVGVTDMTAADLDQEGDLDLVVLSAAGPSLWFNRGNVTFENRTGRSDLGREPIDVTDVLAVDFDRDVDLDLLLGTAGDAAPVGVWENLRHGEFRARVPQGADGADGIGGGPAGFELLDADGNASWDLAVADGARVRLHPSVTPAPGRVSWGEPRTIATVPATRLRGVDHDNDGRVDLLGWGPTGTWLWRSVAGGWTDVSDRLPKRLETANPIRDALARDLDGDGDLDLVALTSEEPAGGRVVLWENRGGNANASLRIALRAEFDHDGTDPKRCNHLGLGSLLELRRGPIYQPAIVRSAVTHFGLGPKPDDAAAGNQRPAGEALRVLWTNGIPEVIRDPTTGTILHPQKLGGSCPYLYTWNGERFAFATDLCWAAPIGLQLAEGVFAPTRAWEHVKIDGAALEPRDGPLGSVYELRVCCELWEAEYFDRLSLTCVDHPPGTDVFTNEKVGPPELVQPHLYATNALHAPAAARVRSGGPFGSDEAGWRDVLETVRTRDEDYLQPFDAKRTQGFTEPWTLELDLAGAPASGTVLLLTGWVFPTDTGINVALSQHPDRGGPRPPALSMETADGETADGWAPVLPNAGFPGGKTKTIALPLPDFPSAHRKVRLSGTQELYWDRAAWCVPGDVETQTTPAELLSAELRYRGFSARSWPEAGHGPDRFDYHTVDPAPLWPPMAGPFTRYGDVRELLTEADDRQAALASGDELALRFAVPPLSADQVRDGWTRDFVISSIGYDKDANLHTVHGQGVLPMPHAAMTRYPPPPDEPFPDTPALRAYLEEYQTRPGDARGFWRALRDASP